MTTDMFILEGQSTNSQISIQNIEKIRVNGKRRVVWYNVPFYLSGKIIKREAFGKLNSKEIQKYR